MSQELFANKPVSLRNVAGYRGGHIHAESQLAKVPTRSYIHANIFEVQGQLCHDDNSGDNGAGCEKSGLGLGVRAKHIADGRRGGVGKRVDANANVRAI